MSRQCKASSQSPAGADVHYTPCQRLGQAEDARAGNELVNCWTGIESGTSLQFPARQREMLQ
jgi:hypothetical protein